MEYQKNPVCCETAPVNVETTESEKLITLIGNQIDMLEDILRTVTISPASISVADQTPERDRSPLVIRLAILNDRLAYLLSTIKL